MHSRAVQQDLILLKLRSFFQCLKTDSENGDDRVVGSRGDSFVPFLLVVVGGFGVECSLFYADAVVKVCLIDAFRGCRVPFLAEDDELIFDAGGLGGAVVLV
jgi:hypothetical protein